MLTRCGKDLPEDKLALHQARCLACGGRSPHVKGTQHPVDYFTEAEGWLIVTQETELQWRLMWWTFMETGARLGEVLALTKKDLKPERELGFWTEKQKKRIYETVPISDDLYDELLLYCQRAKGARLFPVTKSGADKALKRACHRVGIGRAVHTHMFRSGLAQRYKAVTEWTEAQAVANAQRILRHRSYRTTQMYFRTSDKDAKAAHRRILEGE